MTLRTARWVMVLVPASLYVFSWLHRVAPAVVATDLMRAFSITAAALGTLAAIYPYVFVAMALVAGSLADTLGPRWTIAGGGATMGLGAVLFGAAPTFEVAFAGRLLVGLGASVMLIAWLSLAAAWFRPDEFATISGWTQTVGNVGALAAAAPLALLVELAGWRLTFVLIGGATLLLAALAAGAIRDRPEALGLPPVSPGRAAHAPALRAVLASVPGVIANRRTWPPILAAGGVYATQITFLGLWGVPYLTQVYALSRVDAATVVSMIALGMGVGSPLVGWLSDRWLGRRRLPMVVFTALYALGWVPLAVPRLAPPVALLAPFFFLLGLASSGLVLLWSCVREVNDPARVGIALGFCNAPVFLGIALLQWLTGAILDARWTGLMAGGARLYPPAAFHASFAVCLGLAAGAVVAALLVTETRCRNVWSRNAL
ncbi:MAG: MFS transporter [Candidatus Rokubacteria bacterium]|nr:MFS transporter [Candidatus Rokubacteria bacterium]MBI4255304.1 MFS transporter [Candidatus Rokubacteria bacterium]